ncbi:MAG: carboxypeptidase regulatory-like domain-containing protein [Euryarchaeota archaeon]|nr:carboxypeptidase regulatory-like domain-containing protein [Euryarchaeota archaeon]
MKKALMAGFLIAMFLVIAGVFAGLAHGQTFTGEAKKIYVDVYVVDENGNAVQNATVQILNNLSAVVSTGQTNSDGEALFILTTNLTGGEIKISADGYDTQTIQNVTLKYNSTAAVFASYSVTLHGHGYVEKAKSLYDAHKTAIIAGGVVIFFVLILLVIGKGKRVRW